MSAPRVRGITFSPAMVLAIRTGRKTITRRLMKPQPQHGAEFATKGFDPPCALRMDAWGNPIGTHVPPYQVGDHLYIREAWRTWRAFDALSPAAICDKALDAGYSKPWAPLLYEADGSRRGWDELGAAKAGDNEPGRYRHARFMPRAFARDWLLIESIVCERVNAISEDDARAEGVAPGCPPSCGPTVGCDPSAEHGYRDGFASLWSAMHGPESWHRGDWVFVYRFRPLAASERRAA